MHLMIVYIANVDHIYLMFILIFASYGIWENLGAWKILLRDMPMICMSKISRNVIFSKSKNPTPRITQDWGGGIGVLLIALTHSKLSYSYPLLMAVTHRSHGTSFNKLLYLAFFKINSTSEVHIPSPDRK